MRSLIQHFKYLYFINSLKVQDKKKVDIENHSTLSFNKKKRLYKNKDTKERMCIQVSYHKSISYSEKDNVETHYYYYYYYYFCIKIV